MGRDCGSSRTDETNRSQTLPSLVSRLSVTLRPAIICSYAKQSRGRQAWHSAWTGLVLAVFFEPCAASGLEVVPILLGAESSLRVAMLSQAHFAEVPKSVMCDALDASFYPFFHDWLCPNVPQPATVPISRLAATVLIAKITPRTGDLNSDGREHARSLWVVTTAAEFFCSVERFPFQSWWWLGPFRSECQLARSCCDSTTKSLRTPSPGAFTERLC